MYKRGGLDGLAEELVEKAFMDGYMIGSPTETVIRHARERGDWASVPDRCKPGGLIKRLPKKDRERLKDLTAKHFNHRQY